MQPDERLKKENGSTENDSVGKKRDNVANEKSVNDARERKRKKHVKKHKKGSENVNVSVSNVNVIEERRKDEKWNGEKWNVNACCNSNEWRVPKWQLVLFNAIDLH